MKERVFGTKTWSWVKWAVEAWCLPCVIRHEWNGTPRLMDN